MEFLNNDNDLDPSVETIYTKAEQLLKSPFDFYSMSLRLTHDQQVDVANRQLVRYYQMQVNQMAAEKEGLQAELDAISKILNDLKRSAE